VQSTTDPILVGRPSEVASNWKFTAPPCLAHPSSVFPVWCLKPRRYAVDVAARSDPRRTRAAERSCD
jgi:hypothetical protein